MDSGLTDNIHVAAPEGNGRPSFQSSEPPAPTEGATLAAPENAKVRNGLSRPIASTRFLPLPARGTKSSSVGSSLPRRGRKGLDPARHGSEQSPRRMTLRQKQPIIPGMPHQPSAGFHQPLLQTGQGPTADPPGHRQPPPQVYAITLSPKRTSLDRNWWQLNRVIFTACFPSLIHCSVVPRLL
jgi:hypothetical protein